MTKKIVFIFGVLLFCFFFCFYTDDFTLTDMTLILGVDMNVVVSIETHVSYNKPLIHFYGKVTERPI
jgi:hypothetical protein